MDQHESKCVTADNVKNEPTTDESVYQSPARVFVADSHELVCTAIACLLERGGYNVVGHTSCGSRVVRLWQQMKADLLLLDLHMPGLDTIATIEAIRAADPEAGIVVLSGFKTDQPVNRTFRAGARGYLLKGSSMEVLCQCLDTVHAGGHFLASELAVRLAIGTMGPTPTQREIEVLTGVAQGHCNKRIGRELGIGEGTVKAHLKSILRKLDADSRTEAASIAIRTGMVQL